MPQQRAGGAIGFEEIATIPRPGSKGLTQVAFSPDDRFVTYLGGDPTTLTRQLYAFDRETGETKQVIKPAAGSGEEETVSKEEQLRRERALSLLAAEPMGRSSSSRAGPAAATPPALATIRSACVFEERASRGILAFACDIPSVAATLSPSSVALRTGRRPTSVM